LLKEGGAGPTFVPPEDLSAWPEYLKKKMERGEVAMEDEEKEV
jgi:hypothetical protein